MPDHVPVRQWHSIRWRSHKEVNEEVASGIGPLDHISSTNEWPGRKTKSHTSFHRGSSSIGWGSSAGGGGADPHVLT